jgi:uncharacterized membrane protein YqgA involved in biofilm formation
MIGTLLNVAAILVGGTLGTLIGRRLPPRLSETVLWGLGLALIAIGVSMFLESQNALIVLGSVVLGGVLGEWINIDALLKRLAVRVEARFARSADAHSSARFIKGFVLASLVYAVGPMAILGSFQDGLTGDYQVLAVKALLDGVTAIAFAASLGVGVLFSAAVILLYQGTLTLLAGYASAFLTTPMINEMTATGGILMLAISLGALLELRPIRVANYLPALVLAPLIAAALGALGVAGF